MIFFSMKISVHRVLRLRNHLHSKYVVYYLFSLDSTSLISKSNQSHFGDIYHRCKYSRGCSTLRTSLDQHLLHSSVRPSVLSKQSLSNFRLYVKMETKLYTQPKVMRSSKKKGELEQKILPSLTIQ